MDAQQAIFFPQTYNEALRLILEVHSYVTRHEAADQRTMKADVQLQASYESMRMTARLTQVMAWLLLQRAAVEGEIGIEETGRPLYALGGGALCHDSGNIDDPRLPPKLRGLLERSAHLYQRVERLDGQVRAAQ